MSEQAPSTPGDVDNTSEQASLFVLALDDASASLERVGGKGASLARLATAGLPVPPGFHVTTIAYHAFVARHGLQEPILTAVSTISPDQPATLEAAAQTVATLFAQHPMPEEVAQAIRDAYFRLGEGALPVAVRSSTTTEDLPEMSFAGQQETYLNLHSEQMVLDAIKRCWASLWTAQAIGYRAHHQIAPADVSLAVVVQELVPAEAAGILFTANPLTGAHDQVMINAAWGLGEALVGGQVTPDMLLIDKPARTIIQQEVSEKEMMTVRTPVGTREEPVPAQMRTRAVLSSAQAAELVHLGLRIEQLYGQPMDIEWVFHDGRFSVVQARPITALPDVPQSRAVEWQLPNPKGKYIRAGAIELLPDPLSPLFATLGLPIWSRATVALGKARGIPYPDDPLTIINGYGYFDATYPPALAAKVVLAAPRLLVMLFRSLRSARARWQQAHATYKEVVKRWQAVEVAPARAHDLLSGTHEIVEEAARYYITIENGVVPGAYLSEALFTQIYTRLIKRRDDPPALTFLLGFESEPIRAEQSLYDLAQWVREQPALAARFAELSRSELATIATDGEKEIGGDEHTWKVLSTY
ncbi:hypothetical protein KSC_106340 [Ktedonobacter sp. SOSP1-52]|uniref:PEP/pyruvate-binding domain-containing protein n=1 Tax=Ktedonobacter sp. SOSP1-52 TaxID=2778366 RepID=UPI00191568B5|nr:PEP/pyruvate-binding domain-containing protein [Ktedonobacter sp. SOSP1-52]GHO71742.1 hypothetical protein KSC_106340 [Ktedonobacter sp. SOSP1-52]